MKLKRSDWIAIGILAIITASIFAVYFTFYYSYKCSDLSCYLSHQKDCSKTTFIRDSKETTWRYFIKGRTGRNCEVEVEVLSVKQGSADKKRLEGKKMMCMVSLESSSLPESDISRCSGELKEEMQNLIIQKLHSYIIENIGEISKELLNA